MLDRNRVRQHRFKVTYALGRFFTEHFIRVYKAFVGDLTAAIVLGSIGQYNYRRYYTEVGSSAPEGFHQLAGRARTSTMRGRLRRKGRDELFVTQAPAGHFAEFDLETLRHFHDAAREVLRLVEKRTRR